MTQRRKSLLFFLPRLPGAENFFSAACTVPCNFSLPGAYTGREPIAKEEKTMVEKAVRYDVDDLIYQDIWLISER